MVPPSAIDVEAISDTTSIVFPDPLTVNGVSSRRAKAGMLNGGVAASTNSDLFKSPTNRTKPKAKRWDHKLSVESASRQPPSIKGLAKHLRNPGLINLGGGLPSSDYFPIERLDIKIPTVEGGFSEQQTRDSGAVWKTGKHDVAEGKGAYDLSIALNYGQGSGSAQLLRFVTEHTEIVHNPPYQDWRCILSVGNTSAMDMALRMFTQRGDYILAEEYAFATAIETAAPMGVNIVGIAMDDEGLLPESMDEILSKWDTHARRGSKPSILYTVPTGHNPTGATQSLERRRKVYKVAQKHDIYILEDEPYYYLQMQKYTGPNAADVPPPASHQDFLKALVPSLLSLDTDGRVFRMDSFSKVIAPGTRTGWITASEQIINKVQQHNEASVQNPSGISQLMLYKLLDENWGHGGYLEWLIHLRLEYTGRRDTIVYAAEKYLPRQVISWNPPAAGMFLWMKIDWHQHPQAQTKGVDTIEKDILEACIERGVLVIPGSWFRSERDVGQDLFFRATFAAAASDKMDEAIRRFGEVIREAFLIE
ncbi:MAG: hypothetical protein M1812_003136 [Candelaria pacifica]|nr:MAG: hypothetical protein M1812_003136 [Candelaria pacifica]